MSNVPLNNAIHNKNDEFYTRYEDIKEELQHYDFTTLPVEKSINPLVLSKSISEITPQKYLNCTAIGISKLSDIPFDYGGVMAVPLTFLNHWCPDQFEVVGYNANECNPLSDEEHRALTKEWRGYRRSILCYRAPNGQLHNSFTKILIRARH